MHVCFSYKIVSPTTWPNFRGSEKDGVRSLLLDKGMMDDGVLGKTKIFIRSPKTIFRLEEMRSAMIPPLVVFLQKVQPYISIKRSVQSSAKSSHLE